MYCYILILINCDNQEKPNYRSNKVKSKNFVSSLAKQTYFLKPLILLPLLLQYLHRSNQDGIAAHILKIPLMDTLGVVDINF